MSARSPAALRGRLPPAASRRGPAAACPPARQHSTAHRTSQAAAARWHAPVQWPDPGTAACWARLCRANKRAHGSRPNVDFLVADVTEMDMPSCSYDVVFSNWLLMYLSDDEVLALACNVLNWVRAWGRRVWPAAGRPAWPAPAPEHVWVCQRPSAPAHPPRLTWPARLLLLQLSDGGVLFFRESCYKQSGDKPRESNPTHYRWADGGCPACPAARHAWASLALRCCFVRGAATPPVLHTCCPHCCAMWL